MGTLDDRGRLLYDHRRVELWYVVLASLPYALRTTAIIFGEHIDKLESHREKGIRTLPVLLGEKASRYAALGMMVL